MMTIQRKLIQRYNAQNQAINNSSSFAVHQPGAYLHTTKTIQKVRN